MKVECHNCQTTYNTENGACFKCGKYGGYSINPTHYDFHGKLIHRNDNLKHKATGNIYKVKEIQVKGLITEAVHINGLNHLIGSRAYISFSRLPEYDF